MRKGIERDKPTNSEGRAVEGAPANIVRIYAEEGVDLRLCYCLDASAIRVHLAPNASGIGRGLDGGALLPRYEGRACLILDVMDLYPAAVVQLLFVC